MTEYKKRSKDVFWLLAGVGRGAYTAMRGQHGNPGLTMFARVAGLLVVLACGGRILWEALLDMPPVLVALIALAVVIRLVRWYLRRQR